MSELIGGRDSGSGWQESADWPTNLVRWVSHWLGWFVGLVRHAGYWNHNAATVQTFSDLSVVRGRKYYSPFGSKIESVYTGAGFSHTPGKWIMILRYWLG